MAYLMAHDLGTGGVKSCLHDETGRVVASVFFPYQTYYPAPDFHEQKPDDWWEASCQASRALMKKTNVDPRQVAAIALSGHSLVVAPLDASGRLLAERVPIWSDTRAASQAESFFQRIPYDQWYETTGNGDPPACYSVFKLMWLKERHPEIFARTSIVLGSKDYVNYRLTGRAATDPSYASGTGVFDLRAWRYRDDYLEAAGVPGGILPEIIPSHGVVGTMTADAANATGLARGTPVIAGGVDNACMALGAIGTAEGRAYLSLGSSAWIAVNCSSPIIDQNTLPFTFAHVEPGLYTSAVSIFAAGSAHLWARRHLCRDLDAGHPDTRDLDSGHPDPRGLDTRGLDTWHLMDEAAAAVPIGCNGVVFNPSLAGGSAQEPSAQIRGGFMGLTLGTTREDMVRAVMEGVALNLRILLDDLRAHAPVTREIMVCGGGAKSRLWRLILADVLDQTLIKTTVDQDTAALGAAALAARGCGLWDDTTPITDIQRVETTNDPDPVRARAYRPVLARFRRARELVAQLEADAG